MNLLRNDSWGKTLVVLMTMTIMLVLIVQPVTAGDYSGSTEDWITTTAGQHSGKVCPKQTLELQYVINFNGNRYVTHTKWLGKDPQIPDAPPQVKLMGVQGKISDHKKSSGTWDPVSKVWIGTFKFTPEKKGNADIRVEAVYLDATAWDYFKITVSDQCNLDVEIYADETTVKLPTGKTVNETQNFWRIIIWLKGLAKIPADSLVNEGGSGGEQRLIESYNPIGLMDDPTGTMNFFGDGVWLGAADVADLTCGTKGALTCSREFSVHPVLGPDGETIDFQFDLQTGECSSFTVWCSGEGGYVENTVPPLSGPGYQMNAVISREGGSAHYIHQLPYGVTLDYLISAFPVEGE
jgi:hypothetical protein